jgi:hypothetical protein
MALVGAYCSDFMDKSWRIPFGHRAEKFPRNIWQGNYYIVTPSAGYLWDRASVAGVSFRNYGEFVGSGRPCPAVARTLAGHIDPLYRPFDLSCNDLDRADRFITEFKRLDAAD